MARLNELFECIVPIVARHRGHIDQFIGDGVLAVFGAPERIPQHADRAVQCAVEIARTINSRRPGGFEVGWGSTRAASSPARSAAPGGSSFSVIGDAVNLCSRVEAATRETGDPVLITGATRALLSETIEVESRGEREIRGYDRRVELFAPLVPIALQTGPGTDVSDPLGDPVVGGSGARRSPARASGGGRDPVRAWAGPARPRTAASAAPTPCRAASPLFRLAPLRRLAQVENQWAAAHPGGGDPQTPCFRIPLAA